MYEPCEIVGLFTVVHATHQDDKYNWFYRVRCNLCGKIITLRNDRIKSSKHCTSSKPKADDHTYFVDSHKYLCKLGPDKVCDKWLNNLQSFICDITKTIGLRPSGAHNLTRIDLTKKYDVGNVKWDLFYVIHNTCDR
jgi:hypothetical protein